MNLNIKKDLKYNLEVRKNLMIQHLNLINFKVNKLKKYLILLLNIIIIKNIKFMILKIII